MARNIMTNERPPAVLGEFDPCKQEGLILEQCFAQTAMHLSYKHFEQHLDREECLPYRDALDRCRGIHGIPAYHQFRKQDDVPRAPFRKHPTASDRMVQEYYPYPGGKIP